MEQEKVQKKFDLTTHKRNAKGQIIEVNPYTLYIENGERKFERPPKSGWFYSESGQLLSKPKGAEGDRYVAPVVEEFAQEDLLAEIEALKAKLAEKNEAPPTPLVKALDEKIIDDVVEIKSEVKIPEKASGFGGLFNKDK